MNHDARTFWLYHITEDLRIYTSRIPYGFGYRGIWGDILQRGDCAIITVKGSQGRGFAWDGCSPKFVLADLIFGTPDGVPVAPGFPITGKASAVHDFLYQEHTRHGLARKVCDQILYDELRRAGFVWAPVYYWAVRLFGGPAWGKHEV